MDRESCEWRERITSFTEKHGRFIFVFLPCMGHICLVTVQEEEKIYLVEVGSSSTIPK